jgi:hypothetical protein
MDNNKKNPKYSLYLEIAKIRFGQFNKRRDFEFKLNALVWTVLLLVIGFVYRTDRTSITGIYECLIVTGIVGITVLYILWMYDLHKANHLDLSMAILSIENSELSAGIDANNLIPVEAGFGSWRESKTAFSPDNWIKKYFYFESIAVIILAMVGIILVLGR